MPKSLAQLATEPTATLALDIVLCTTKDIRFSDHAIANTTSRTLNTVVGDCNGVLNAPLDINSDTRGGGGS